MIGALLSLAVSAYASVHCRLVIYQNCKTPHCACAELTHELCGSATGWSFSSCTEDKVDELLFQSIHFLYGRDRRTELMGDCGKIRHLPQTVVPCWWDPDDGKCKCPEFPPEIQDGQWEVTIDDCTQHQYPDACSR